MYAVLPSFILQEKANLISFITCLLVCYYVISRLRISTVFDHRHLYKLIQQLQFEVHEYICIRSYILYSHVHLNTFTRVCSCSHRNKMLTGCVSSRTRTVRQRRRHCIAVKQPIVQYELLITRYLSAHNFYTYYIIRVYRSRTHCQRIIVVVMCV